MRIGLIILMFFVVQLSYSQNKFESILVYRHGCHGTCKVKDSDSCGLKKDTVFELIMIQKTDSRFLKNNELFELTRADSLNALINLYWDRIDSLNKSLELSKKALFVPPYPNCSEFEDFTIFRNQKTLRYEIFNNEHNETFEILTKNDLEIFNKIKKIIK
ncbi:MAG: hypothetical protein Q8928_04400 [Bacteroidota bacterium]|nr:hypothetical protein [Bacteroidota bacterium]